MKLFFSHLRSSANGFVVLPCFGHIFWFTSQWNFATYLSNRQCENCSGVYQLIDQLWAGYLQRYFHTSVGTCFFFRILTLSIRMPRSLLWILYRFVWKETLWKNGILAENNNPIILNLSLYAYFFPLNFKTEKTRKLPLERLLKCWKFRRTSYQYSMRSGESFWNSLRL